MALLKALLFKNNTVGGFAYYALKLKLSTEWDIGRERKESRKRIEVRRLNAKLTIFLKGKKCRWPWGSSCKEKIPKR